MCGGSSVLLCHSCNILLLLSYWLSTIWRSLSINLVIKVMTGRVKSQLVLRDASVKVSYIPCNSSFIEMKELKAVVRLFKLKLSTDILKVRTRYRDSRDFIIYLLQTHCTASEPPSPLLPVECQLTFTFLSAAAYCCRAASSKILHFTRHQNAPRRHRRV